MVFAATSTKRTSWEQYNSFNPSLPGSLCVARMTLVAEGDTSKHKVYTCYTESFTLVGGQFTGTQTWTAQVGNYQKAYVTSTYLFGMVIFDNLIGYTQGFTKSLTF